MIGDWLPIGTSDADPDAEWISVWGVLETPKPSFWKRLREWFRVHVLRRPPTGTYGYTNPPIGVSVEVTVDDDETHSHTEVWKLEKKA